MQKQIIYTKKYLIISGLILAQFIFGQFSYASYEISDGSVRALYHLEDLVDSSANGYNLTQSGGSFDTGLFNNGFKVVKNNSNRLSINNDLNITGGLSSFCTWIKLTSDITGTSSSITNQNDDGTKVSYDIYYEYNGGTRRLVYQRVKQGVVANLIAHNVNLGTSQHFVCMTYDNTYLRAYLDGYLVESPLSCSGNGTSAIGENFSIGSGNPSYSSIDGTFDDSFVLSKALTASSVEEIWNGGTGQEICTTAGCAATTSTSTSLSTSTDCNIGTDSVDWTLIQKAVEYIFYLLLSVLILSLAIVFLFGFFKRRK